MKFARRLFALLPALFLLPLPARAAALDRPVAAMVAPLESLGVFQGVVRIARGDRVLFERAWGLANAELGVKNRVDGVFRVASVSKLVTKMAIGRLADEGKLTLDDPLARWIPAMKDARVTIRQALLHRGGIPHENSIPYDEEAAAQGLDSLVRRLAASPLDFEPGSRRSYSNGGYALLAAVIERASGKSYAEYLQSAVLTPLGLVTTRHERDGEVIARRAYGYRPSPRRFGEFEVAPYQQMDTKTGGGSLVSTAADLHRLMRAIGRDPLLRKETWSALFTATDTVYYTDGRCPGFNSVATRSLADEVCVVVLANNYAAGMLSDLADSLAAIARGERRAPFAWRVGRQLDAAVNRKLAGRYESAPGALWIRDAALTVRMEGDDPVLFVRGEPADVMIPQPDGSYLLRNLWSVLRVRRNDAGAVTGAEIEALWRPGAVPLRGPLRD